MAYVEDGNKCRPFFPRDYDPIYGVSSIVSHYKTCGMKSLRFIPLFQMTNTIEATYTLVYKASYHLSCWKAYFIKEMRKKFC